VSDPELYAQELSSPPDDVFARIDAETRASYPANAEMMIGPLVGTLLAFVVRLRQPRRVLEIGTFTGWSSIAMALALPEGATLVSLDVNEETTALARGYAEEAGVADRIDYRIGPALELLPDVEGPFDVVFIDAWKDDYLAYFEAVLPRLADNGIILCDNTLSGMRADHPLAEFNRRVRDDPRVECLLLPVRDGVTLIRRRSPG
jgi:predicted O-methyltransferase YrrM